MSRVVIRWIGFGPEFELLTDDPGIECLSITEASKSDRVYRLQEGGGLFHRVSAVEIDALIGDPPIGALGDKPVVEQAIRAMLDRREDGRPNLTLARTPSITGDEK